MKEKLFIDYLHALEAGTDDLTVPDEPQNLAADDAPAGHYVRASDGEREIPA